MDIELDKLLCLVDGKISAYRLKHFEENKHVDGELLLIQRSIIKLYDANKTYKGVLK